MSDRWGQMSIGIIDEAVEKSIPLNTARSKASITRQFNNFCTNRGYVINANTTISELADILKDYACNMRKLDGTDYKESVIKTHWNTVAKELQESCLKSYGKKFNPFSDLEFKGARDARDYKRKQLQKRPEKRKQSAAAFTKEELSSLQKCWDEDSPAGLQKKFFNIVATELAWRGNEAANALVSYFQKELDNYGNETGRIVYNPVFTKTNQGGARSCANNKWLTPNEIDPDICPVRLFRKLMEKRPPHIKTDRLFITPNPNWKLADSKGWYKNTPVGICELSKWTKNTAEQAGLDTKQRKITNHSHRSTAVTQLANAGVSDQQLIKITGHGNSNSIAPYLTIQPKLHEEVVNKMRGNMEETSLDCNRTNKVNSINNVIATTTNTEVSTKTGPRVLFENCTFNIQTFNCNELK